MDENTKVGLSIFVFCILLMGLFIGTIELCRCSRPAHADADSNNQRAEYIDAQSRQARALEAIRDELRRLRQECGRDK
jgi:hypothetical protein